MGSDLGLQTFDEVSWWSIAIWLFVTVAGIGFLTYSQPEIIALGAALLIVGGVGLAGVVGSRHLEVSDAGVTTRRFFHWSRTYPRSEVQGAAADWSIGSFSMPLLNLKSGRQVRLWSVSRPTLLRFQTRNYTAEIVGAINSSLAYRIDPAN
jgi:hypothetical protein